MAYPQTLSKKGLHNNSRKGAARVYEVYFSAQQR